MGAHTARTGHAFGSWDPWNSNIARCYTRVPDARCNTRVSNARQRRTEAKRDGSNERRPSWSAISWNEAWYETRHEARRSWTKGHETSWYWSKGYEAWGSPRTKARWP